MQYRSAVKTGTIDWVCKDCSVAASTAFTSLSPEPTLDPPVTPPPQQPLYDSDEESSHSMNTSPMSVSSASPNGPDVNLLPARDLGEFTENPSIQESNLEAVIPSPATYITDTPDTPTFQIIKGGSAKGSDILVENEGYTFAKMANQTGTANNAGDVASGPRQ